MFKMRNAFVCLPLLALAMPGLATTVQSMSYSSWTQQVTGTPTTIDLGSLTGDYSTVAGVTEGGYIFTGPDGTNQWWLETSEGEVTGGLFSAYDGVGGIEITLPGSGQSAIFLSAEAYNPASYDPSTSVPLTVTFPGDSNAYTFSGGTGAITSSSPLTSLTIYAPSGYSVLLSSADFGTSTSETEDDAAPSAEAATIAMVGGGMLVLFGAKRKLGRRLAV